MRKRTVIVNDKMQKGYRYPDLNRPQRDVDPEFPPDLSPPERQRLGAFCGKHTTDAQGEFPQSRFKRQGMP